MFQQDTSEFVLRSSEPVNRSTERPQPLWRYGTRAVGFAVRATAAALARVVDGVQRRHREAVTVRQLSALRDRELRDIGIERGEIRSIARALAQDEVDPRKQSRATRPSQQQLTLVGRRPPLQPCCS